MFLIPPLKFFVEWQICHYKKRLIEAINTKEKRFLKSQLYNIKQFYQTLN
jgi:hypothetical protein